MLRWFLVALSILAVVAITAMAVMDPDPSEQDEAFARLFPTEQGACPDGLPDGCICQEMSNLTDLPMRYSLIQTCPHPVQEDVLTVRTFTADGAIVDDGMMKGGQLHGAAISWHPNGQLEAIANFDEGRQVGFARGWHDNGALSFEQQFEDGQPHGLEIRYTRSGEVESVFVWDRGRRDHEETLRISERLGIESP